MRELTADTALGLYALHVMAKKSKPASLKELSRSSGFKISQVRRILDKIRQAGLIESRPARGYVLARPPGEISVRDVFFALETARAPAAPCGGDFDECATRGSCVLAPLCRKADQSFQEALESFTLADLRTVPVDFPNCLDPRPKTPGSAQIRPEAS